MTYQEAFSRKSGLLLFFSFAIIFSFSLEAAEMTNLVKPAYYFVGREKYIKTIDNLFKSGEKSLAIVGISGMGKTELAREYAKRKLSKYEVIWYFDMSSDLRLQFQILAHKINTELEEGKTIVSEDILLAEDSVKNYIQGKNNWLLIFDNYQPHLNEDYRDFLVSNHNFKTLVLAKNASGLINKINVGELSEKEIELVISKLIPDLTVFIRRTLIEKTKGFPLLLVQFLYLIKEKHFDIQNIIEKEKSEILSKIVFDLTSNMNSKQLKDLIKITMLNTNTLDNKLLNKVVESRENLYYFTNVNLIHNSYDLISSNQKTNFMSMNELIKQKILELTEKELVLNQLDNLVDEVNQIIAASNETQEDIFVDCPYILSNLEYLLKNAENNGTSLYKILELRKNMSGIYFNLLDYKRTLEMLEWFTIHRDRFIVEQMNEEQKKAFAEFLIESAQYKVHIEDNPKEGCLLFKEAIEFLSNTSLKQSEFFAYTQWRC